MSLNLFSAKGTALDRQRFTWRDMVGKPISKLDDVGSPGTELEFAL